MSKKNKDNKNRWRCKTIAFRASPDEAYRLDLQARTSGLTKQDYILKRLFEGKIIIHPNIRIQMYLEKYLLELTAELKRLSSIPQTSDVLDNIAYLVKFISKLSPEQKEN